MYRAVALAALRAEISPDAHELLADLAVRCLVTFSGADNECTLLDGEDVSNLIRTLEIGQFASKISVHSEVRKELVRQQQAIVASGGFVLEGRDTTTVVAPKADLKIFLTASIEERARRRWLEGAGRGGDNTLQEVVVDVVRRDFRDYSRDDSPLALAEDAVIIETFGMSPPDVVERVVRMLEDKGVVPTWVDS